MKTGNQKAVAHARMLSGTQKPINVIPREARNLALRRADRTEKIRAMFLAEFTLSELRGFFASLRMTCEGL